MREIKNNICIILICIFCIILTCVILFEEKNNSDTIQPASSFSELVLKVGLKDSFCNINIWQDTTDNVYYFFLPSGDDEIKLFLANLAKEDSINIDGKAYKADEEIYVEYGKTYTTILELQGNTTEEKLVFVKSENLPSLFIDTETGTVDNIHSNKEIKEKAEIVLHDSEGRKEYSNKIEYIKTRGNSTFEYYDKKPYQIKLFKEHSLLGMAKAKKWILLANAVDDSLIRNDIIMNYARQYTEIPASNGQFIDLYINGNYMGNYYLCEKIAIDEEYLDINNLEYLNKEINGEEKYNSASAVLSEDGNVHAYIGLDNPDDITGGYIVEYDVSTGLLPNSFRTNSGKCFNIVSPEKATMEQAQYICNLFNEYENAVQQENGVNPLTGKHYSEYMDIDSWASKYVVEESFANPDSTMLSMYFYKDYDSVDSHIYCGPMWDYDRAMGGDCINQFWIDDPYQIAGFGIYVNEMMQHKEVFELVQDKFEKQIKPYVNYQLSADVYNLSLKLESSYAMDKIRWPQNYGYYTERDSNYDYLIGFMENKISYLNEAWIDGNIYCKVTFLDYNGAIYKTYSVKRGEPLSIEPPTIANYVGIFNGWYSVDRGVIFDSRLPVYEDVTYSAKWIDIDLLMKNGLAIAEMDISEVDSDILYHLAELVNEQQNLSKENEE